MPEWLLWQGLEAGLERRCAGGLVGLNVPFLMDPSHGCRSKQGDEWGITAVCFGLAQDPWCLVLSQPVPLQSSLSSGKHLLQEPLCHLPGGISPLRSL